MTEAEKRERAARTRASENDGKEEFPAGMRVLAVDDDPICLKMLENLLRQCRYKVTVTPQAVTALKLLRESKEKFDIVISDVHMPDMDGFKLLEIVGLEMDLPVIMMSASSEVSTVMKGIKHGARDYLLKPIRIEQLKNIWQHVIRKTLLEPKEGNDTTDNDICGTKRGSFTLKVTRKSRDQNVTDHEADDFSVEDSASQKKQRVSWSRELHKEFISAVEQLGIENAVPKRILDIMNNPGLTRENVASHLQKYRKALKLNCLEMNHSSISSDKANSNPSTAGLGPFEKCHTKSVNCLKGLQIDGYNSNSDVSWYNNSQNPRIFGVLHGNTKPLPCIPIPHDGLLQRYAKTPVEAGRLFHTLPNTDLGDASADGLNYLSISSITERDTFAGLASYIPGLNLFDRNETNRNCLLEYAPSGRSLITTFSAAEPSCLVIRDGTANDHDAIATLGQVQNSLPGPQVSNFQPKANADFGTSLKLKSSSMDLATGNGDLKPIENPDPPLNLGIDDIFNLSNDDSLEDLGAVVSFIGVAIDTRWAMTPCGQILGHPSCAQNDVQIL